MGMNQRTLNFLSVLAAFFFSGSVFAAGIEVEPYEGYGFLGTSGHSADFTGNRADGYGAVGLGVRITQHFDAGFYLGPDLSYYFSMTGSGPGKVTSGGSLMKLGLVAGYSVVPNQVRVWTGFNLIDGNTTTGTSGNASFNQILNGVSYKVGAGCNLTQGFYLNAEYFFQSWGSTSVSTGGAPAVVTQWSGSNVKSGNLLLLSFSVPFGSK